jgi:hypothetical protein
MRRAKRMAIVLTAITIVTTLVASPMSASAQTLDCPEGTTPVLSGPGEVCVKGPGIQLSCPEGYELVPAIPPTNPQILFYCELVPPDSGGGDKDAVPMVAAVVPTVVVTTAAVVVPAATTAVVVPAVVPAVVAAGVVPAAVVVPLLLPRRVCRNQRLESSTKTLILASR